MRAQKSWRSYARLISWLSGGAVQVQADRLAQSLDSERALIKAFDRDLRGKAQRPSAEKVLTELDISLKHYRQHLRYIATWDLDRRRLLAEGASMRLLEDHRKEGLSGQLSGLALSGTVAQQRHQLAQHLKERSHVLSIAGHEPGWLLPQSGARVQQDGELRSIWIYPPEGLVEKDALHPTVARSLISRYLSRQGTVIDPMAGGGNVAIEAVRLGHRVWASDVRPVHPFIAKHDLDRDPLSETMDGQGDLLVLHPPVREDLKRGTKAFEARLTRFIEHAVGTVKLGGYVALIVSTAEAPGALQTLTRSLVELVNPERHSKRQHELHGHFLAAARDGSQAWHILVSRNGEPEQAVKL